MASAALALRRPLRRPRVGTVAKHAFLIVVALAVAYPFYYMVSSGFKDIVEATSSPPTLVPRQLHPENFVTAWNAAPWPRYFANTIFIAAAVTLGELTTAVLAAYAFARMGFRGKAALFTVFLATLMIPGEATLIPNFVMMSRPPGGVSPFFPIPRFSWYDTYQAQIVPFLATAFSIFLLRQFFLSIPNELADAARIDGAGHLRFLWSVVLPLSVPALVTVGLIQFLASWNAFQWPLIVTARPDVRPLTVGLLAYRGEASSAYHLLMAASTFLIAPIVVLYFFAQRYLVQGIARTGIRG